MPEYYDNDVLCESVAAHLEELIYFDPDLAAALIVKYHALGALDCDGRPVIDEADTLHSLFQDLLSVHPDDYDFRE